VTQKRKPTIGRPKLPAEKSRSGFISTRVSASEKKEIKDAIKKSQKKKSDWLREVLLEAARKQKETN
jgi:hypothetical protein